MRRRARRAVGAGAAMCVAGCAALSGADDLVVARPIGEDVATGGPDGAGEVLIEPEDNASDDGGGIATTDGPTADTGRAPACPPGSLFCDDFENGNFSRWTNLLLTNGGQVSILTDGAHAGTRAMRALAPKNAPNTAGQYPSIGAGARFFFPPHTAGTIAVRAYVFMPAQLAPQTTILKLISSGNQDDMNVKVHAENALKVDTDTAGAGEEFVASAGAPIGRWFCLEWQATVGAAGRQLLLLDREVILDRTENNATPAGYDRLLVGFAAADGDKTQEVRYDDVVLAQQPIGCP